MENPFESIELRMVHKILKDAGYVPNWIELNNSGVRTYIAQMYLSS
ncbi:DnaJ family domain-containing protein [Sporotomaculum syntrophicum]|nr:DnaJ family domain-containing protein [Sporotomaculum syntrophicum]